MGGGGIFLWLVVSVGKNRDWNVVSVAAGSCDRDGRLVYPRVSGRGETSPSVLGGDQVGDCRRCLGGPERRVEYLVITENGGNGRSVMD